MQIELSFFVNVWEQINPSCCVFPQCFLGQLSSLVLCMLHLKHLQKAQVCQVLLQAARQRHMILAGISVAQKHFASQWTVKKLICPAPAAKGWFLLHWVEVRQYYSRAVGLWPLLFSLIKSMPCSSARSNQSTAGSAPGLSPQSLLLSWVGRTSSREKLLPWGAPLRELLSCFMYDSNTEKAEVLKKYSAARWKDLTAPVQENKPTGLKPALSFQGITNRLNYCNNILLQQ